MLCFYNSAFRGGAVRGVVFPPGAGVCVSDPRFAVLRDTFLNFRLMS